MGIDGGGGREKEKVRLKSKAGKLPRTEAPHRQDCKHHRKNTNQIDC